jgi:sRNA-binding carbon storage regulator CsrA
MLVLSRRLNESLLFNDDLVLTVTLLTGDYAELSLLRRDGPLLGTFTARPNEWITLVDGVRLVAVRVDPEKVRLGIDANSETRIERSSS